MSSSRRTTSWPICSLGWLTVVSCGLQVLGEADVVEADQRDVRGQFRPRWRIASSAPMAISSLKQKIAVGRPGSSSSSPVWRTPDSIEKSPMAMRRALARPWRWAAASTPARRSLLIGLASGPVTTPIRVWPRS
jgi:hypothetical protein